MNLALLEKETRRQERSKKRIEHDQKKTIEGVKDSRLGVKRRQTEPATKAIEWNSGGKKDDAKEKRHRERKEKSGSSSSSSDKDKKDRKKSDDKAVVVYSNDKKKEKEKDKERKHRHHHSSSSKEKKRKGSTSSSSDDGYRNKPLPLVPAAPPSPSPSIEDDFDFVNSESAVGTGRLRLPYNASMLSLAPAILQNVPGGNQAQQLLNMGQSMMAMVDTEGDSPLTAMLLRLTDILDTFDCLNASIATLVASLQKDPDAIAMIGLTLAEVAAIVAKTAPGVIIAAKAAFPIIFSLLASPQFLVTAGASVIMIGGYQIIRRVTGMGAAEEDKNIDADEEHLAFGDVHDEEVEVESPKIAPKKIEAKPKKLALLAPVLPPSPPATPIVEDRQLGMEEPKEKETGKEKEKEKSKRQAFKALFIK